MKKIVLFCGAPADIQYALSIYDQHKKTAKIAIFCVNVEGMYKFLSSLDLNLQRLVFIPYTKDFSIKNPAHILNEKRRLNSLYKKYFINLYGCEVYFFSHFYDWLTFGLISKLAADNSIFFVDHYDSSSKIGGECSYGGNSLKDKLKLAILQYIANTKFRWLKYQGKKILEFLYDEYGTVRKEAPIVSKEIYENYSFKKDNIKDRSILIFESDRGDNDNIVNYEKKITGIVTRLKQESFHIFLKPHPRLGYSKYLQYYIADIYPEYVPGEFIDGTKFSAIIGIETVATARFARDGKSTVYSLIDLFNFKDEPIKERYKDYLVDQSNGKIRFVNSVDELIESLEHVNIHPYINGD